MITVYEGSILDVKADAIVNPANSFLNHGGGLARVIDQAAQRGTPRPWGSGVGPAEAYMLDKANAKLIPVGGVHAGPPGVLPFKVIIHAVGPIWGGGGLCEFDLLELAMENACEAAIEHGCNSIAVPAISCGIFGFPVENAARILVSVAGWYNPTLDITFAVMGDEHAAAFRKEVG